MYAYLQRASELVKGVDWRVPYELGKFYWRVALQKPQALQSFLEAKQTLN